MNAIAALKLGARQVLRLRKLIVFFYLLNLIAAAVVVMPGVLLISGRLAHSFESDRLYTNQDVAWVVETLSHFRWWPITAIGATLAAVTLLFFILNTFLAGGAISVFHDEKQPFFSSCARYFPRLFRLMLISLVFYGLVLGLNSALNAAINRARESSMESHTWTIVHWIQLLIVFFLLCVVNMIIDYGKIICVAGGQRSAFRATIGAFRFVAMHLGQTSAVYWMCTAIGLLFLLVYYGITEGTGQNLRFTILLVLSLRQIYMIVRVWLRLWTWSSELNVYTFNSTIVAPEPPSLAAAG